MRELLFVFLMSLATITHATTYYVSSSGNNEHSGTAPTTAWQSLSKIQLEANGGLFKAGDSILFKKGETFTGTLKWTTLWGQHCPTGTKAEPITFSSYGTGSNPIFLYPAGGNVTAENRVLMLFSGVDYIVIDGLDFTDTDKKNDKISPANCGIPIYLGTIGEATTNHCIVRNVNISLCGMGVVIVGNKNLITNSRLTNFKNLKSTPDTGGNTAYEDYGANAITITGDDNEISNNYISGAWAESLDFGWNGGACEMFNNCHNNKLVNNTIYDCGGVAEFGGILQGASSSNNLFAFNKIINCGTLTYCNISGEFAIDVSNIQYFNNSIIEDSSSRFSGVNTGRGLSSKAALALITADEVLFGYNGKPRADVLFNLKNNIFQLSTGISVAGPTSDTRKFRHENNIYRMISGRVNYKLNKSETETAEPVFQDTSSPDPTQWDYNPRPAIKGKNAGAYSRPLPAHVQVLSSLVAFEAILRFSMGEPGFCPDFSFHHRIIEIKTIDLFAAFFFIDLGIDDWTNSAT